MKTPMQTVIVMMRWWMRTLSFGPDSCIMHTHATFLSRLRMRAGYWQTWPHLTPLLFSGFLIFDPSFAKKGVLWALGHTNDTMGSLYFSCFSCFSYLSFFNSSFSNRRSSKSSWEERRISFCSMYFYPSQFSFFQIPGVFGGRGGKHHSPQNRQWSKEDHMIWTSMDACLSAYPPFSLRQTTTKRQTRMPKLLEYCKLLVLHCP